MDPFHNENKAEHLLAIPAGKDEIDRRGFLSCMALVGTGVLWTMTGGILLSESILSLDKLTTSCLIQSTADLIFVQISDSHIGFNKEANPDVTATLRIAID